MFFFLFAASVIYAQSGPSFFPLAPCPGCSTPSTAPASAVISSPPGQPCDNEVNISDNAAPDKPKKQSKHKQHKGAISGGTEDLMKQLIQLLIKILEILGGNTKNPPAQSGTMNPVKQEPKSPKPTTPPIKQPPATQNNPVKTQPTPCPTKSVTQAQKPAQPPQSQPKPQTSQPSKAPAAPAPQAAAPAPSAGAPAPPPIPGNWKLVFDEPFNGNAVDTSKWSFVSSAESTCVGDGKSLESGCSNPGNQQLEFNWGKNCTVANGILTITAKKEAAGGRQWTSCMLHSIPKFQTMYMEARIKIPSTPGFWPAFWTWEGPSNEVDVFEYYTESKQFSMTNHTGARGGCDAKGFDPTDGFHVYSADIYQGGVRFYIDGKEQCNTTGSPKAPVSILLDLFVHDRQRQAANSVTMETDYIRAWQKQ